jgi:outer membrane cobalamin receptor
MYYRRLGNINLRPELAHEYGAGLTWEMQVGKLKYLTLTVDGYYNDVTDKIVAFPSTYVWRMVNYGKAEIVGMDVTMGTQIDITKGFDVKATAAATWQRAVDKTNKNSQIYNNLLPYTPRISGNGSVIFTTPWLSMGYSVMMQGRRYSAEQNSIEYRMPSFWEHSLSVQRSFKVRKLQLDVQAKCTNILDAQYDIIQYYPMPGRQFNVSLVVKY